MQQQRSEPDGYDIGALNGEVYRSWALKTNLTLYVMPPLTMMGVLLGNGCFSEDSELGEERVLVGM